MQRRTFFKWSGFLLGAGLVGYGGCLALRSRERIIVALLQRELGALALEREILDEFARDLLADRNWTWWQLQGFDLTRKWNPDLEYIRDYVLRRFVLSTDYFSRQTTPDAIHYLGLYDPYRRPCANPFYDAGPRN